MGRSFRKSLLAAIAGLGLVAAGLLTANRASAYFTPTVTINVTLHNDSVTPCTLNGAGTKSVGPCTLRGAILTANAYPSINQVINILVPFGSYHLHDGSLTVNSPNNIVQIFGAGKDVTTVDGSGNDDDLRDDDHRRDG